jgi:hypothetical protein
MGRSSLIKKILSICGLIALLLWNSRLAAQVGYVNVSNRIYHFLERMQTRGILKDYNSFELPKTKKQIGKWLRRLNAKKNLLGKKDREILTELLKEFYFETFGSAEKNSSLLKKDDYKIFGDKRNFLYFYSNSKGTNFYVNLLGGLKEAVRSTENTKKSGDYTNNSTTLFTFGGKIGGTFYDQLGFEIKGTNGTFSGDKLLAESFQETKFNYKFTKTDEKNVGSQFFDNTEGYLAWQKKWMEIKVGSDRNLFGEGILRDILSNNSPREDYIALKLRYKAFSYTFYHEKLLGEVSHDEKGMRVVSKKNLAYHRFGLRIGRKTFLNVGEMVIYSFRDFDLAYLNPFNFYKSSEHAGQDRDNTFLFFDLSNYSFRNFKLFASVIIDDLDFSKIGTHWWGNKLIYNAGFYTTVLNKFSPLDVEFQYLRIDPFVYTHRLSGNNYTNFDACIGAPVPPNSSSIAGRLIFTPTGKLSLDLNFLYSVHGANVYGEKGELVKNVGGSLLYGDVTKDFSNAKFLDGLREYSLKTSLKLRYKITPNYEIIALVEFVNDRAVYSPRKYIEGIFSLSAEL